MGFKRGQCIVLVEEGISIGGAYRSGHCYRQNKNGSYLLSVDSNGQDNGWQYVDHSDESENVWRWATRKEAEYYDKIGEPFNVEFIGPSSKSKFGY